MAATSITRTIAILTARISPPYLGYTASLTFESFRTTTCDFLVLLYSCLYNGKFTVSTFKSRLESFTKADSRLYSVAYSPKWPT